MSLAARSTLDLATAAVLALAVEPGVEGAPARVVPGPHADAVAASFGLELADELALHKATGSVGEVLEVPVSEQDRSAEVVCFVGRGDGSAVALRRAGAALARRAAARGTLATSVFADAEPAQLRAGIEGVLAGAYRPARLPSTASSPTAPALGSIAVYLDERRGSARAAAESAVAHAVVTSRALAIARDLTNLPADLAGPVELAGEAARLGAQHGLDVVVKDEDALRAEGFGGLLAVAAGSMRPARLVEVGYAPEGRTRTPHVVLVGKGITFDSGGLSLKPRDAMVPMKTDMAGAGAVLAVMTALAELGVRVRVTALLALAENMPSGGAYRPGDVIRHYGGTTVEVLNTDAEGRLVLADALAYADAQLEPDIVVDLATLTGAASIGLGRRHAALYSTDERLAAGLLAASERSGDRAWRMPLVEDYRAELDSPVADLAHVPRSPTVGAGSITAALFLREFAGRRPWAHLDIAGPARADADEHDLSKGGTGFGVRLLLHWLETLR